MSGRAHGTYAKYRLDGCRCYPCAAARSDYDANRNRAIAYGTWQPWVPAEPVRVHIEHLRACGMGLRVLAAASGTSRTVLRGILGDRPDRAPCGKVRPATAQRILAVQPTLDVLAAKTPIDATGTVRRLRALVVMGWSQAKLADRLGITPSNFTATINAERVTVGTARAVRDLYRALVAQVPPERTQREKIAVARARNHARAKGWAGPMAWDEDTIDNPHARPSGHRKAVPA